MKLVQNASEKIKQYDQLTRVKKKSDNNAENGLTDVKAAKEKEEQNLTKIHKQFPAGD